MKISRRDDFALIFMKVLSREYSDKFLPVSYIARETRLSSPYLKHIASSLRDHGLVESREGISGGYRLAKKPSKISVAKILEAVSEKVVSPSCVHGTCRLKKTDCTCFSFWGQVNSEILQYLGGISLAQFSRP